MNYDKFEIYLKKLIKKTYPLKISFDKLYTRSHFHIKSNDGSKFLPFKINIDGEILNGKYKNYKIIKVITNQILSWNKYKLLYVSLLNINHNPCINIDNFLFKLHTYNYLDILQIKKIIIESATEIEIEYVSAKNKNYNLSNSCIYIKKVKLSNHFYFESFSIDRNFEKLKIEMDRLIKNRDKYKSIHFHLDNNGGGDNIPGHLILRCLVGKKEKWMKNIKKILINKKIYEWDCWREEDKINSPSHYEKIKKINLDHLPNYDTKYNGKIYLHMTKQNGSAAWYFITYLIYAFSNKINRYSKKCYGQTIKYGTIESDQLKLIGHSGTTSGDGNAILVKYENIEINCSTEQFISCSIKECDWNRFWMQSD